MLKEKTKAQHLFNFNDEEERLLFVEGETKNPVTYGRRRRSSDYSQNVGCGLHWSLNMIFSLISAGFVAFILYKAVPGYYFFSIHPITMALGYGFIMFQAIRVFSSRSVVGASDKRNKIALHWILQVVVLLLCAIGFGVVYYNKNRLGKNHFVTWHSWIGLLTVICSAFIAVGGICAKNANAFKKYLRPVVLKSVHALAGAFTFVLACFSLLTGLNSNYFTKLTKDTLPIWQLSYAVPPILALVVLLQAFKSILPRLKTK